MDFDKDKNEDKIFNNFSIEIQILFFCIYSLVNNQSDFTTVF